MALTTIVYYKNLRLGHDSLRNAIADMYGNLLAGQLRELSLDFESTWPNAVVS